MSQNYHVNNSTVNASLSWIEQGQCRNSRNSTSLCMEGIKSKRFIGFSL